MKIGETKPYKEYSIYFNAFNEYNISKGNDEVGMVESDASFKTLRNARKYIDLLLNRPALTNEQVLNASFSGEYDEEKIKEINEWKDKIKALKHK